MNKKPFAVFPCQLRSQFLKKSKQPQPFLCLLCTYSTYLSQNVKIVQNGDVGDVWHFIRDDEHIITYAITIALFIHLELRRYLA